MLLRLYSDKVRGIISTGQKYGNRSVSNRRKKKKNWGREFK